MDDAPKFLFSSFKTTPRQLEGPSSNLLDFRTHENLNWANFFSSHSQKMNLIENVSLHGRTFKCECWQKKFLQHSTTT